MNPLLDNELFIRGIVIGLSPIFQSCMITLHDLLVYFTRAWAEVTNNIYYSVISDGEELKVLCPETSYTSATSYQYGVVILSTAVFYMICYLLHKLGEDWVKIIQLRNSNSKFLIDHGYNNDSSTPKDS